MLELWIAQVFLLPRNWNYTTFSNNIWRGQLKGELIPWNNGIPKRFPNGVPRHTDSIARWPSWRDAIASESLINAERKGWPPPNNHSATKPWRGTPCHTPQPGMLRQRIARLPWVPVMVGAMTKRSSFCRMGICSRLSEIFISRVSLKW